MTHAPKNVDEWQRGLYEAFRGPSGLVGERLVSLQNAEQITQRQGITEFAGFATVADACFDFAIDCLDILANPPGVYHILRTPLIVASIARLRSSYVLFWMGYYFDAASLLRGIFEHAIHLCAAAHGWFDVSSRFDSGDIDLTEKPLIVAKKMHKLRQAREKEITSQIYGARSGLSIGDQDELAMLVKLMHSHVHETEMHLVLRHPLIVG